MSEEKISSRSSYNTLGEKPDFKLTGHGNRLVQVHLFNEQGKKRQILMPYADKLHFTGRVQSQPNAGGCPENFYEFKATPLDPNASPDPSRRLISWTELLDMQRGGQALMGYVDKARAEGFNFRPDGMARELVEASRTSVSEIGKAVEAAPGNQPNAADTSRHRPNVACTPFTS